MRSTKTPVTAALLVAAVAFPLAGCARGGPAADRPSTANAASPAPVVTATPPANLPPEQAEFIRKQQQGPPQ